VKRNAPSIRKPSTRRAPGGRTSAAAAQADAAERERIRGMSARERALLALDLGERLAGFVKPPP
jgi:hypothetical protein